MIAPAKVERVYQLLAAGWSSRHVALEVGISRGSVNALRDGTRKLKRPKRQDPLEPIEGAGRFRYVIEAARSALESRKLRPRTPDGPAHMALELTEEQLAMAAEFRARAPRHSGTDQRPFRDTRYYGVPVLMR